MGGDGWAEKDGRRGAAEAGAAEAWRKAGAVEEEVKAERKQMRTDRCGRPRYIKVFGQNL